MKYSPVHQRGIADSRPLWAFILSHFDLEAALKMLADMIEEDEVDLETVEDLIPPEYVYTRELGFISFGRP